MRIAIIGGGIAGLAAAFELERVRAGGAEAGYRLFEAGSRLGGVLASEIVDGSLLELGPDSFLTEKPAAAELCRELGLGDELTLSSDSQRKTFVLVKNRLVPLPDGLMFLVPTRLLPTVLSPLFSIRTKLKMALELLLPPPAPGAADESVAAFVTRHYGVEAVDRLADPLLGGIYGGEASQLSAQSVLPKLVEMERKSGSLTRGMLAARRNGSPHGGGGSRNSRGPAGPEGDPDADAQSRPRALFTTLKDGMGQLVDALEATLAPGSVRLSTPVTAIQRCGTGWRVEAGGGWESFDAAIVCTPAWAAAAALEDADAALSAELQSIPYSSSIAVNLIYEERSLPSLPGGFGFLVPPSEGRAMLACTFVHRKFPGRASAGKAVLRAFLGGVRNEPHFPEPDEALVETVRRELEDILGVRAAPLHVRVTRWSRAMPQYAVGHQDRIDRIRERLAELPGLKLAGNAYEGVGIPDCIQLGRRAAREAIAAWQAAQPGAPGRRS